MDKKSEKRVAKKKIYKKRKTWPTSRDPQDILLRGVGRYLKSRHGAAFILGPIGIMDAPDPRPLGKFEKFYVAVSVFGRRPNLLQITDGAQKQSPCHKAKILFSRGDGVNMGSCEVCQKTIIRTNPRTGKTEWLNGESPWTDKDAPMKSKRSR